VAGVPFEGSEHDPAHLTAALSAKRNRGRIDGRADICKIEPMTAMDPRGSSQKTGHARPIVRRCDAGVRGGIVMSDRFNAHPVTQRGWAQCAPALSCKTRPR
jgi:hypothetical protein